MASTQGQSWDNHNKHITDKLQVSQGLLGGVCWEGSVGRGLLGGPVGRGLLGGACWEGPVGRGWKGLLGGACWEGSVGRDL